MLLLERGMIDRETLIWHDRKPPCLLAGAGAEGASPVGLQPVLPALYLMLLGVLLSGAFCSFELVEHRAALPTSWRVVLHRGNLLA